MTESNSRARYEIDDDVLLHTEVDSGLLPVIKYIYVGSYDCPASVVCDSETDARDEYGRSIWNHIWIHRNGQTLSCPLTSGSDAVTRIPGIFAS